MKLIEADKVEQAIKDYWKAQVDKLPKPGNVRDHDDFVDRLNSYIEHNHELLKAIDELPSAQPERIKGHWIAITSRNNTYKCSVCGRLLVNITDGKNKVAKNYPYCHCGADMRPTERNSNV